MATLSEIRNKLHSVENIKKITRAMEMVAGSRLYRSQAKTENGRPYFQELQEILNHLLLSTKDLTHPLIKPREVNKIGLVVVAGDRGLCGAYNNNIFNAAHKFLNSHPKDMVELIPVGEKALNHFIRKKWVIRDSLVGWGGKISFEEIKALANDLIRYFLFEGFDEIWLIYTRFETLVTRKVIIEKFLNIEIPTTEDKNIVSNYIFEPSEQDVFDNIIPRYCFAKVQMMLNEAFTSELSARVFAMRAATKNADEMIEKLTLIRNKVRQAAITRELIEITSGSRD